MPVLLLLLGLGVFLYLWLVRRGTTLTRDCRWRLDRSLGPDTHRCAACGAITRGQPRDCLRDRVDPAGAAGQSAASQDRTPP